jgi:hypothetical protein
MMTGSILSRGWRTRDWWNNLLRREVMLRIFLTPVRSGPDYYHFWTSTPSSLCLVSHSSRVRHFDSVHLATLRGRNPSTSRPLYAFLGGSIEERLDASIGTVTVPPPTFYYIPFHSTAFPELPMQSVDVLQYS